MTHSNNDISHDVGSRAEAPLVIRERPSRAPFVSRFLIASIAALVAVTALALTFGGWMYAAAAVAVPEVTGLAEGVARTRISQAGLSVGTIEKRFDQAPEGIVLAQFPDPAQQVRRGTQVSLVVSAGTEEFLMPDVTGLGIAAARGRLEQAGLVVRIEAVVSEAPVDTVVETVPAPGSRVRTAEVVRIRIAAEGSATSALLPYRMEDLVFVIDPEPPAIGDVDITFEVSRRLRSLVEASGARVVVTRSTTETDVVPTVRAERALEATPVVTAFIGIDAPETPPGGIAVLSPYDDVPASREPGVALVDELVVLLSQPDIPVQRVFLADDPVARDVPAPAVRVRVGSFGVPEDLAAFRDPTWADTIARAIYRALGERFASR